MRTASFRILQLCGSSLQLCGSSLQLCGSSLQLYGRSLQLYGRSLQLYGRSLQLYGRSLQLCGRSLQLYGSLFGICEFQGTDLFILWAGCPENAFYIFFNFSCNLKHSGICAIKNFIPDDACIA